MRLSGFARFGVLLAAFAAVSAIPAQAASVAGVILAMGEAETGAFPSSVNETRLGSGIADLDSLVGRVGALHRI